MFGSGSAARTPTTVSFWISICSPNPVGGAFEEDKRALEEVEALIERDRRPDFRDMIIASDKGGVHVLRMFHRWASEEAAENGRG